MEGCGRKIGPFDCCTVIQGDCVEVMAEIPDKAVDLLVTDPPYALTGYTQESITHPGRKKPIKLAFGEWDKEQDWINIFATARTILRDGSSIYVFVSHRIFGRIFSLLDRHFERCNFFVWHKPNPAIQISKTSYLSSCELVLWAHDKGHIFNFTEQTAMHNFWNDIYPMGYNKLDHPTQKPLALIRHFISTSSNVNHLVFDPFMGSGTTAEAAKMLDRHFFGCDINESYVKMAEERLSAVQMSYLT